MSGPERATKESTSDREIACAKCGQSNPHRANVCGSCGAHLHVVCHNCGHRNERSLTRCAACGHKFHRSLLSRVHRKIFGKNPKISLLQLILLLLAILFGMGLIVVFSEYRAPEPEGHYAPLFPTQLSRHA